MVNIHNLAGRIANLYYDYDYYDFNDSLEVGETMEDAIFKIERVLSGKGGVGSYIDFMDEIIDNIEWEQTEDPSNPNYGGDMLKRAKRIRNDLYSLKDGWIGVKNESLQEDTVKRGNSWVNKGKEGTHGKFKTKKGADAQRKAMFANGYKGESFMRESASGPRFTRDEMIEIASEAEARSENPDYERIMIKFDNVLQGRAGRVKLNTNEKDLIWYMFEGTEDEDKYAKKLYRV